MALIFQFQDLEEVKKIAWSKNDYFDRVILFFYRYVYKSDI